MSKVELIKETDARGVVYYWVVIDDTHTFCYAESDYEKAVLKYKECTVAIPKRKGEVIMSNEFDPAE